MPDKNPDAGPHNPAAEHLLRHTAPPGLKRWVWIATILAVAIAGAGIGWRLWKSHNTVQWTDDQAVPTVQIIRLSNTRNGGVLNLPGNVEAFANAPIYAQVSGYLQKWYFDIGAHVKAGDVLAEIDTPQVDQQLNQAKATLKEAQAALDLSRVTYQRDQDLLQRRVIAQQDFDTAASDLGVKQATLNADEAAVLSLQALEDFKIVKVPFDGIVTSRNTDIGALVNSGSGNPLFTVAQVKPLRVYINVPENMSQDVAVGASAELRFNEFPGREFAGKVVRTAGAIDPNSRTLLTEVDVPNESGELFPGAYTQVRLVTGGNNR